MNQFRVHFATPWARTNVQDSVTFATGETTNNQNVTGFLSWDGMNAIQKGAGATTQFKIRFTNGDNGNVIADYLMLGTAEGSGAQPRLLVTYEY